MACTGSYPLPTQLPPHSPSLENIRSHMEDSLMFGDSLMKRITIWCSRASRFACTRRILSRKLIRYRASLSTAEFQVDRPLFVEILQGSYSLQAGETPKHLVYRRRSANVVRLLHGVSVDVKREYAGICSTVPRSQSLGVGGSSGSATDHTLTGRSWLGSLVALTTYIGTKLSTET